MRGATHPGPGKHLLPCHSRSAQCRSGEKWTERGRDKQKGEESFLNLRQRHTLYPVLLHTAADDVKGNEGERKMLCGSVSDVKTLWQTIRIWTYDFTSLSLTPPPPPSSSPSLIHAPFKWSDTSAGFQNDCIFIFIFFFHANSEHFSSKHILLPHIFFYFLLLTSISLDWMVWNENVHIASSAHPFRLFLASFLSL